jgi:hypothetical protein
MRVNFASAGDNRFWQAFVHAKNGLPAQIMTPDKR